MPTRDDDTADQGRALESVVAEALSELPDEVRPPELDAIGRRWLAIGARLGLERPERARSLLELMAGLEAAGVAPADDAGGPTAPFPLASSLLARAAALPPLERASAGPDVTFGWAASLAPAEILQLGRVVGDMLAAGSPQDTARGFGITWSAGVRVPRHELEAMMREFTELEITVGGILAGRELRTGEPAPGPRGIAAWLGDWRPRTRPEEAQAAAAIDRHGDAGRRGLVALWNAWMGMRYRTLIPPPTFDLLVHAWVTVVGPLPAPVPHPPNG